MKDFPRGWKQYPRNHRESIKEVIGNWQLAFSKVKIFNHRGHEGHRETDGINLAANQAHRSDRKNQNEPTEFLRDICVLCVLAVRKVLVLVLALPWPKAKGQGLRFY